MNTLLIVLAQTKLGAAIEILSLLLVAGIIGYITAWLYYKSVYEKKIIAQESEKNVLNNQITSLNAENNNLHKNLLKKDTEIDQLTEAINDFKTINAESVPEKRESAIKNRSKEHLIIEKDDALAHISERKHLLNYKSFGTAKSTEKDDLTMISGIGPFIEERLHALDIYTFKQISNFTAGDIETINDAIEYFSGRIERDEWVEQARELFRGEEERLELLERIRAGKTRIYYDRIGIAYKKDEDDLTIISGIGGWIKEKLNVLDIFTFRQISNFNDDDIQLVTEVIEYFPGRIERDEWIVQAQELVRIAGKKSELLKRIRERKGSIYYDRLGIAHKHQANNLTLIKGIGLWIEERLNMLDIFTFEQISKLTPADVETITEILEISPDRVDRDNWVSQARALAKKKLVIV